MFEKKLLSAVSWPSSDGSVPLSWLMLSRKLRSAVSRPIALGIVPVRPALCNFRNVHEERAFWQSTYADVDSMVADRTAASETARRTAWATRPNPNPQSNPPS